MIIKGFIITVLAAVSLYATGIVPLNSKEKEEVIVDTVKKMMEEIHFQPREINDDFSGHMYDTYLEMIDGSKRFLTQEDLDQLAVYKDQLDDQINARNFTFFDLSLDLLEKGIEKTRGYYEEILDRPFDFTVDEQLEVDAEKRTYPANDADLKAYWTRLLKYETLTRLADKLEENEEAEEPKSFEELEQSTREKVKKVYEDWYGRLDKLRRSDRFEAYIDAMVHGFDPHSDYFSPKQKEDFDIRMSGKLEGIGARLQADGDYTKVVSIIPGGPAWKGKELEVNDLIVQVAQDGEEFVDITGMRLDDVVQLIRGKKGTKVTLQVKKKDGSLEEILIERDEVVIEEGKAKSVIMSHSGIIDNIGFIRLPSFYSDFSNPDGNSCADDIATELEKLKEQDVNGVVIDLRYNGGGSLSEVVEMAGFFVEEGPIVQVKPRGRDPFVYTDRDNGEVKYDGPLVVLVNEFSVSASEILAAALQDYDRAVIIGSQSTFGKGTVQRFYDLDRVIRGGNNIKPLGEVKITTQKFYRIDGGSTQLKGVESDIVLPDTYHYIKTGEKDLDNAMQWTQIEKREYQQNVYHVGDLNTLTERSEERIDKDPEFQLIEEQAQILKDFRDDTSVPLNLEAFQTLEKERKDIEERFEDKLDLDIEGFEIANLPQDYDFIHVDSSRIARNDEWLKSLHKDIYAEEALNVMKDMIELNQKSGDQVKK
jgi:carboxyl-terminal processing protease